MEKKNVLAIWQTCKLLVKQAKEYANKGYSRNDSSGNSKINNLIGLTDESKDEALTENNIPKEILDGIIYNFNQVLEFVSLYLLQNNGSAFYGLILVSTEIGIDLKQRGLIDIKANAKPIKITYNPFFAEDYSLNELLGASLNEVMKIIYMHPAAYEKINKGKDPKKHSDLEAASNVSSTELVTNDITFDGRNNRVRLNDNLYTKSDFDSEISEATNGKTTEGKSSLEYYYKIAEAYRKPQQQQQGSPQDGGLQGNAQGNSVATPDNSAGSAVHDWESIADTSDLQEELKDLVKEAYDNLTDRQRGNISGKIIQQIEMLFKKPELSWKAILRKYIGIIPAGHRPSRMRLNRRQPDRFDLSGQLSNKVVRLVIAIDTSGSMSDSDIAYCMNEIYNITKVYETEITVIECDMQINNVYMVRSPKDIHTKVAGRGGTSFTPAIEYINSHKYKDAVMIYFTDGYGDHEIPKPRTYRNLWVVMNDSNNLSVKNPYGEVKSLKADKDYAAYKGI